MLYLDRIVNIIDWLGYQLLSLDCEKEEICLNYPIDEERLDVSCKQISGVVDFEQIQNNFDRVFITEDCPDDHVVFRAMILYDCKNSIDSSVVLLQDCAQRSLDGAKPLTVIGMSSKIE